MMRFYFRVKNRVRRFFGLRVRIASPLRRGVVAGPSAPYGQCVYTVEDGVDYVRSVGDVDDRGSDVGVKL